MVAGEVKSRLSDSARAFHLTSPIAVQGEALLFSWKTGLQIYEQYATRDDLHLKMSLFML
jgi:CheY-specific phosphatase CheX